MKNIFSFYYRQLTLTLFLTVGVQLLATERALSSSCYAFYGSDQSSVIFSSPKTDSYYQVLKRIALKRNWQNDPLVKYLISDFLSAVEYLKSHPHLKAVNVTTSSEGFTIKGTLSASDENQLTFIIPNIISDNLDYGSVKNGLSLNFSKFLYSYIYASIDIVANNPSIKQVDIWPFNIVNPKLKNMLEQVGFKDDGMFSLKIIKANPRN